MADSPLTSLASWGMQVALRAPPLEDDAAIGYHSNKMPMQIQMSSSASKWLVCVRFMLTRRAPGVPILRSHLPALRNYLVRVITKERKQRAIRVCKTRPHQEY